MVEMERAGLPTVSFTAAGFVKDARRSAQAFGLTALPIAVVPLPLTNQTPEEVRRAVDGCIDQVIQGLPESPATIVEAPAAGPTAERLTIEGADTLDALDRMNGLFLDRGWSDAFPLVPPTPDRVDRMLGGTRGARGGGGGGGGGGARARLRRRHRREDRDQRRDGRLPSRAPARPPGGRRGGGGSALPLENRRH